MQFDINEHRDFFIAADTDSAIFSLEPLLIKKWGINYKKEKTDEEILKEIQFYIEKYSEILNNKYLNNLSKDCFNIDNHYFNWKTENILKTALWTGKRRYAQYIIEKEGIKKKEFEFRGLELFKSNMNPIFKRFGENLIKEILFGKSKSEIDQSIIDFYNTLKTLDPKLLGRPTGVSYIKKYTKSKPTSGQIFSTFELGAPINTKAAIIYNDLLRFKKLDKKYESIIEGDKIFIMNLKPNPYYLEVMAIPSGKLAPELEEFIKEYIDVDEIFESILLGKLRELFKDINWSFVSLNPNENKFFVYE